MERFSSRSFDEQFPSEYALVAPTAWNATFRERKARHGGQFPAGHPAGPPVLGALNGRSPRPSCGTCDTSFTYGVNLALVEWHGKGCPGEIIAFTRSRIVSRMADAQGKVEAFADDRFNRPAREMRRCAALAPVIADPTRARVLELILWALHGADEVKREGSVIPYQRIALVLGVDRGAAFAFVADLLDLVREVAPRFAERRIDSCMAGLASVGGLDAPVGEDGATRGERLAADGVDQLDAEAELLDAAFDAAAATEAPLATALEAALGSTLVARHGEAFAMAAVTRAKADTGLWSQCTKEVGRRRARRLG